jgi:hypothetical protein
MTLIFPASTPVAISLLAVSRLAVRFALSLAALLTQSPELFRDASAAGRMGLIMCPIAPG